MESYFNALRQRMAMQLKSDRCGMERHGLEFSDFKGKVN